jgi:hypothetical protein
MLQKRSNRLFPGIYMAFGEISQIFPYDSLFDLLYQFYDISVFIGSRNRLEIIKNMQFVWVYILMITMMMIMMIITSLRDDP